MNVISRNINISFNRGDGNGILAKNNHWLGACSTTLQATENESSAARLFISRFTEPTTQENGDYQLDSLLPQPLLDSAALQGHIEPRTQEYRGDQPKSILSTPAVRSADLQDLQDVQGLQAEASVGGSRRLKDTLPKHLESDAATVAPKAKLPAGFYWKHYLRWHEDLRDSGIEDRASAEAHYIANGRKDSRLYKPVSITLRCVLCNLYLLKPVKFFSKLNYFIFGYFDPINTFF